MDQFVQAIYEQGVFRPLEPVELPEHQRVSLVVSNAAATDAGDNATQRVAASRHAALAELRRKMDALPEGAPHDGLGGADHDQILYGSPTE